MANTFSARARLRLGAGATASIVALVAGGTAAAQSVDAYGVTTVSNSGTTGALNIVEATRLVNSGTISGTVGVTKGVGTLLIVENSAGGTITGTGGTAISATPGGVNTPDRLRTGTTIINAGTINGDVVLADGAAEPNIFVSAGGTLNGSLRMANPNNRLPLIFVQRGEDDGVTGTIDAGLGNNVYARSYSADAAVQLGTPLPASFEYEGVEALGTATTVTLTTAPNSAHAGVSLLGDGNFVLNGTINPFSSAGVVAPTTENPSGSVPFDLAAVGYGGVPGSTINVRIPGINNVPYNLGIGGALNSLVNQGVVNGDIRVATASFANQGTLALRTAAVGTLVTAAANRDFSFANSGSITLTDNGARGFMAQQEAAAGDNFVLAAVRIRSAFDSIAPQAVTIDNSGSIAGGLNAILIATTIDVTNSGTVSGIVSTAQGNVPYDNRIQGIRIENGFNPLALAGAPEEFNATRASFLNTATGVVNDGVSVDFAAFDSTFENRGTINATSASDYAVFYDVELASDDEEGDDSPTANSGSFVNSGTLNGAAEIETGVATLNVANSGSILTVVAPPVDVFAENPSGLSVENDSNVAQTVNFTNSGLIRTIVPAGSAVTLNGEVDGDGEDDVPPAVLANLAVNVVNSGIISSEGGGQVTNGSFVGASPQTNVASLAGGLVVQARNDDSNDVVTITNTATGTISATGRAKTVVNSQQGLAYQAISDAQGGRDDGLSVALAVAADRVSITNAGLIRGGPGVRLAANAPVTLDLDEEFQPAPGDFIGGAIYTSTGSIDTVINQATGTITGSIALGAGNDRLENYGTINGATIDANTPLVDLGDGDDTFVQADNAIIAGTVNGGAGSDTLVIDISGGGSVNQSLYDRFINFEITNLIGDIVTDEEVVVADGGTLELGEDAIIDRPGETAVSGSASGETVANSGTINGNVDLGGGNDDFATSGTLNGDVDLGEGDDNFTFAGGTFSGTATGGEGRDTAALATGGTATAPTELSLDQITNFEVLANQSGTTAVSGSATFEQVAVTGGRLIGRAGSSITGDVSVGNGATFGSAGAVVGDVTVASGGTLSPGASPGTMTITGDLTVAAGTNTLFELTPTVSDQIILSGALTIAQGATLTLTGDRPLTPGSTLDLIVANGGINGDFTTVVKPASIAGFVTKVGNRIQLLGQFAVPTGANAQVTASIGYVNAVLTANQASAALLAALPVLTTGGTANAAAFRQLTPEAYATASQIGVENGLSLAQAHRTGATASGRQEAGLYSFAQGLGDWRRLSNNAGAGVSRASTRSYGVLGGIGFGSETGSVGAFVGYLDTRQRIGGLAARTDSDGLIAGISGAFSSGGLELAAMVARDFSEAETRRTVPGASARSEYKLRSWVVDASAAYKLVMDGGWALKPQIGYTYIDTKRGGAVEAGTFGLIVDQRKSDASFIDGSIAIQGGTEEGATFHPWVSAGLRHQVDGRGSFATARFAGTTASLGVIGQSRDKTLITAGVGGSFDVGPGLKLFGAYQGEFGDGRSSNVNMGLRFNF